MAGPQLVVPVMNARYALNAANARWSSLYDALYGTDALGTPPPGGPYDPGRGARVIAWVRQFLDDVVPLAAARTVTCAPYRVVDGRFVAELAGGRAGHRGRAGGVRRPRREDRRRRRLLLVEHHGLGIELVIDPEHPVGGTTSPVSPTSVWRRRSRRSWTARTRSLRSTPPTRRSPTATGSG